jgi:GNAT superfamily N-acetyltransferase
MTYDPLPDSNLATVVTWLEMRERPAVDVPQSTLQLRRVASPTAEQYRALFRRVGSPWLWFSRLVMADDELEAIIRHPRVDLFEVAAVEAVVGMLELDFRTEGECELAFVGLVPGLSGQGHGKWLLAEAVTRAWAGDGVAKVHVHTCSLDHPAALTAYRRAGFTPCARAIERFPDPRLLGILPLDCAPQVPVLGTEASAAPPAS